MGPALVARTGLVREPVDRDLVVVPRGQVYVIPQRCKGCDFCIEFCPRDVLVASSDLNAKGYHYPLVAPGKEDDCVNCRFCTLVCPEFAIYSEERVPAP